MLVGVYVWALPCVNLGWWGSQCHFISTRPSSPTITKNVRCIANTSEDSASLSCCALQSHPAYMLTAPPPPPLDINAPLPFPFSSLFLVYIHEVASHPLPLYLLSLVTHVCAPLYPSSDMLLTGSAPRSSCSRCARLRRCHSRRWRFRSSSSSAARLRCRRCASGN